MERLSRSPKFQPIKFGHSRETKFITPERWLSDFEKIEIKDDVRPLILKNNAARLLKLA